MKLNRKFNQDDIAYPYKTQMLNIFFNEQDKSSIFVEYFYGYNGNFKVF